MRRILCFCLSPLLFLTISPAWGMELPSAFDLRNIDSKSYIGAVHNQGDCGSCYSFGALAAAESTWNLSNDLYDDQAIDLSEAFIMWSLGSLYEGFGGCDGASYDYEELTGLTEYGVPLEADFPYTQSDPGDDLHWDADRYSFEDWYRTPPNDIETIKRIISQVGAVDAAVYVDDAFETYAGGIFENDNTAIDDPIPNYSTTDHAISLVGWNDDPGDDSMGYWILRNSWGSEWGEDGYMRIRYTSALAAMEGAYLIATPWSGESIHLLIEEERVATPWSSGGTLNAHGVDLWGGAASSVTNQSTILAEADGTTELATARGVYLWGGPEGYVVNTDGITALSQSRDNQALAYGICMQGGRVENSGQIQGEATSHAEQAMAFGLWAANGGNALEISNSGGLQATALAGDINAAYGIWADSRSLATVINSGQINAFADNAAVGVLLTGGPAYLENSGTIQATADPDAGFGTGVRTAQDAVIVNTGAISGTTCSIYTEGDTLLTLDTGSELTGWVSLGGSADLLFLTGSGSEDVSFYGVETLTMSGDDWSLSGDSYFGSITITRGRLGIDGDIGGDTTILADGTLGGNGALGGNATNHGTTAPGQSIGHLTIDGNYTQADGTLEIEVGDGVADQLTVTGTASLSGALRVLPDGYASGGDHTFLVAGAIDGAFDTVQSVAILQVDVESNTAGALEMAVTRNAYAGLATPHTLGLAENLDAVRRADAADDFSRLLDDLDMSLTTSELNTGMTHLTPRIHGLATAIALDGGQARLNTLGRRMDRSFWEQETETKTAFWVEVPSHHTRYSSDGAYFGAREKSYGVMFGAERVSPGGLTLGLSGAQAKSRYESDQSPDRGNSESLEGYLYGRWDRRQTPDGLQIGAAVGVGTTELDADRSIAFFDRTARSSHDGRSYSALLQGGYDWTPGNWVIGPSLGVSWVSLHEKGFQESGADSANLDMRPRNSDSLQGILGGRFKRPFRVAETLLEPELRLAWHHEFNPGTGDLEARLSGGGDYFATPAPDLADDSLLLGIGLTARWAGAFSGSLNYDCALQDSDGTPDHALRIQAAVMF